MIVLFLGLAAIIYGITAYMSYSETIKASSWYFIVGIILANIANIMWMILAKNTTDNSKLVVYGLIWDSILTLSFLLTPFLFFDIKLSMTQTIGLGLIIAGIICTKV